MYLIANKKASVKLSRPEEMIYIPQIKNQLLSNVSYQKLLADVSQTKFGLDLR